MIRSFTSTLALLSALAAPPAAQAAPVAFSGTWSGSSQIVEVLDPGIPIVRFETTATGLGSFDLAGYSSSDIVNMATGVGSGTNVFTAMGGDELFGSFTVQIVPTALPGVVELFGDAVFTGGTGLFTGAGGAASFFGTATFVSADQALATLSYLGVVSLVPEPGSGLLASLGLTALLGAAGRARRRASKPRQTGAIDLVANPSSAIPSGARAAGAGMPPTRRR